MACEAGYLLNDNTCEFNYTCPDGYYENSTVNTCEKCHYPCATCEGSETTCTSCLKGSLHNNECPLLCPDSMYSSTEYVCTQCVSPCLTCLSEEVCLTCENGTFFYLGECLSECPNNNYYENSDNNSCVECVPPCSTCLSVDECLSCTTGFIELSLYECVLQCNETSYVDEDFACQECVSPCIKCYSDSACVKCELPYVLYNEECISEEECGALDRYVHFYYNYSASPLLEEYAICDLCTYPCASCEDSAVVCSSCAEGYMLVSELSTCVQDCPDSYYYDGDTCEKCDGNCYNCHTLDTNCTECGTGMYLFENECLVECPEFYYESTSTCVAC